MRLALGVSALLMSQSVWAIVNIENLRMDETKPGFATSTTLSAEGKRGNTDEDILGLTGGMQWISNDRNRRELLLFEAKNSQSGGNTFSEAYFLHFRHTEQITQKWAWETFLQHQSEPLNNKSQRNLIGTNARYKLDRFPFYGFAGMGVMYEQRSVEPEGELSEDTGYRFNFYLDSKYKLTENTQWKISLYAQPKVSDIEDMRSVASTGITTQINQTFAFTLDASYSHDSRPLTAQKNYDFNYKTGINIRF